MLAQRCRGRSTAVLFPLIRFQQFIKTLCTSKPNVANTAVMHQESSLFFLLFSSLSNHHVTMICWVPSNRPPLGSQACDLSSSTYIPLWKKAEKPLFWTDPPPSPPAYESGTVHWLKQFLGTVFVVLSVSAEYGVGPGAGSLKVEEHVRVCVFGFKLMQKLLCRKSKKMLRLK